MVRRSPGKMIGLVFGCLVVGVMLFMMFAVLGGLLSGGE
jgi:tetrahydromethanopterin S-methyltransferase subunit G